MLHIEPTTLAVGLAAAIKARNTGVEIDVSHIALGDGAGTGYTPSRNADGLRNERARMSIGGGEKTGPQTVTVQAHFQDTPAFWVREVGFVLTNGTFLSIWSDEKAPLMYKTADGEVVIAFSLFLGDFPENSVNVVVSGPDVNIIHDREFALIITNQAKMMRQQFHYSETFKAEHGHYPGA